MLCDDSKETDPRVDREATRKVGARSMVMVWVDSDMSRFESGVQTVAMPAGGDAVFDVKVDEPGLYPFVSHAFAHVDLGQVGLLKVGNVKGTMSH